MSKWEMASLKNVTTLMTDGDWVESKDQSVEGIRLVQTGNIGEGEYLDKSKNAKYISDKTFVRLNCTEVFEGDVLVSRLPAPVGRACILPQCSTRMITTVDCTIMRFDEAQCILGFFVYFSMSPNYLFQVTKHLAGSTRVRISRKNLETVVIPLPPLETQKQIAKTLDTAAELLAMRKQQLAELDNLIKSTFNDMFGDPVANEKGWNLKPIRDFSVVKIGPFGSLLHVEDYIEGGFPLVNPSHIIGDKIVPDTRLTLSGEKFKELKSYIMKKGDIVVGRRGEIGRCAVVDDEGFLCGTGSMFIRIENDYLPMLLQRIISSNSMRARLEHQSVGVTMKNLNAATISSLVVPIIPLHLQIQYADIVTKIEQQKALVKKAIDETQYLFDSLISEYFE